MCLRTSPACFITSKPRTRALPVVGARSVARIRTVVVLPAPLGPSSPKTIPWGISMLRSARATVSRFLPVRLRAVYTRPRCSHSMAFPSLLMSGPPDSNVSTYGLQVAASLRLYLDQPEQHVSDHDVRHPDRQLTQQVVAD